ncbi:chromosomal replication initiator protein DnaA [Thalassospira alkalitolerans]|uniref:Chromosomal replication initiator protein DnaA n=1 Tax=Thalassospira alkalitolerans TaxID=1293890 RepID=A0A1Y2LGE8_9PROT|nr:chromosomal replication initiator protein DnaA [Thalassospira alkalitolerans]OSQ50312.1 chromosomal replication initiation protein [Thalassospira alkalitolerans]
MQHAVRGTQSVLGESNGGIPSDQQAALDDHTKATWQIVREKLRSEFGATAYRYWLDPVALITVEAGVARLGVPTRAMRDWVTQHYLDRIQSFWHSEDENVHFVEIVVILSSNGNGKNAAASSNAATDHSQSAKVGAARGRGGNNASRPGQAANEVDTHKSYGGRSQAPVSGGRKAIGSMSDDGISAALDPRYTFDNFVIGKPNEFAYAAARRLAEAESVPFNPLFLYGGVGLGKTHLMHSIAWHIRRTQPHRTVIYLSAEKFMYRFIRALRDKNTVDFKDQFRSVDVLMVDDVQFISGKDSTQEEFFHTFNALVDQGRQIIVSADKSPSDLEDIEERLRSRLGSGLVADIHATTYELRLGILESKAERLGVELPQRVMEFLAHKITANVRELEGAFNRVIAHAQLVGREIGLEMVQDILHDVLRASERRVSIEEIQKKVAEHFNIKVSDMHSARRARAVARPRQVAMYLSKQLTTHSLPEIGRKFGGRDHTTVMHAVRKVDELHASDPSLSEDIDLLRRMLES